ncbi:hypothetical protein A6768_03450 [Sphingobium yanoikuyae]|uniref:Uncharacterized protein n=1 Tax=Sphingobium yanoikuyae TaxID=13690 RepID=A0A291MW62_SPHYA|nr:hypothetical protein A6768_03450 [Sphingobium yanoikuyae]
MADSIYINLNAVATAGPDYNLITSIFDIQFIAWRLSVYNSERCCGFAWDFYFVGPWLKPKKQSIRA